MPMIRPGLSLVCRRIILSVAFLGASVTLVCNSGCGDKPDESTKSTVSPSTSVGTDKTIQASPSGTIAKSVDSRVPLSGDPK